MQKFKYVALDINKKKFEGSFLAENEEDLKAQLAAQGLFLVSTQSAKGINLNMNIGSKKVKLTELTNFCRQFAILINAGITIVESLDILRRQPYTPIFKDILDEVYEDVKSGSLLSEALDKHETTFPDFFRSMTYVGEMSGSLDAVLSDLATYYENDDRTRRQVKSAMSYPLMLVILVIGIIALMFLYIVPTFKEALANLDVEMPWLTQLVFNMSNWFVKYWYILLGVLVLLIVFFKIYTKTEGGRYTWDKFKYRGPVIKGVTVNTICSRFTHGFALLIASGMDVVDAMKTMNNVFSNKYVEERFGKATEDVQRGTSLTQALTNYPIFPDMLIQMVAVGERTGQLDEVLTRSQNYYDEQLQLAIARVTALIQPVMLVVAGGVIAVMFMAIYSPILQIVQTIG